MLPRSLEIPHLVFHESPPGIDQVVIVKLALKLRNGKPTGNTTMTVLVQAHVGVKIPANHQVVAPSPPITAHEPQCFESRFV